mmetsp:Transcript_63949/g.128305  ORF Transcript_63949/g.128305 Transcript_63949/m.128305 type:complete len:146 (+) Transcript_63949:346-783(+)
MNLPNTLDLSALKMTFPSVAHPASEDAEAEDAIAGAAAAGAAAAGAAEDEDDEAGGAEVAEVCCSLKSMPPHTWFSRFWMMAGPMIAVAVLLTCLGGNTSSSSKASEPSGPYQDKWPQHTKCRVSVCFFCRPTALAERVSSCKWS